MFKKKYRIVRDKYAGYEVQFRFWWLPFIWFQAYGCNTRATLESAESLARRHQTTSEVVKEL